MSTLKVTNIQATGETASRAVSGVAAAWVNFDGSASSIITSQNISSLTDNATGDFSNTFTSSFSNDNYSVSGMPARDRGSAVRGYMTTMDGDLTSSAVRTQSLDGRSTANPPVGIDYVGNYLSIHGDLA
jgi:hypothetical protein